MRSIFYFKPLQLEGEEGLDNRVHICKMKTITNSVMNEMAVD